MVVNHRSERRAFRVRALIVHEGELLVVRHRADNPHYVLPGGHLNFGERIEDGLVRELQEEFGVTANIGPLCYVHTFTQEREDEVVQSFECFFAIENSSDFRRFSHVASHAHELYEVRWLGPKEDVVVLPKPVYEDFSGGVWPLPARHISGS